MNERVERLDPMLCSFCHSLLSWVLGEPDAVDPEVTVLVAADYLEEQGDETHAVLRRLRLTEGEGARFDRARVHEWNVVYQDEDHRCIDVKPGRETELQARVDLAEYAMEMLRSAEHRRLRLRPPDYGIRIVGGTSGHGIRCTGGATGSGFIVTGSAR